MMALLMACATLVEAQSVMPSNNVIDSNNSRVVKRFRFYGFVRTDVAYDSRQQMTVCGGEYSMIPYDEDWNISAAAFDSLFPGGYPGDETGVAARYDRNAVGQMQLMALTTRMGVEISETPWGCGQLSGKIEGDFAGFGTTNSVLRIRFAYLRYDWSTRFSHKLLVGQFYHPLSGTIMPDVLGFAAGAPFRPHSRTPQVSYTLLMPQARWLGFNMTALYQFQYTSPGPDGESAKYANQSIVPELFVGVQVGNTGHGVYAQMGCDYTLLTVRHELPLYDASANHLCDVRYTKRLSSFSPTLYFQYLEDKFSLKYRTVYAENLGHLNMLSGYGMVSDASSAGGYSLAPTTASVSYLNLCYGHRWRGNLFVGYQKNLGLAGGKTLSASGMPDTYGDVLYIKKGINNLNSIFRVAPSLSFNTRSFSMGIEYELTACTYGDIRPDATIANNDHFRTVVNHRLLGTVKYSF